ncbi:hypothetical protein ACT3CD_04135 [Geofilum sp. OHC36d9]|uniref:hypothetical protein n=1 Tax=Geofilum sp. OHC36d9 TaxID=3458413 RepID=UPI004033C202
MDNKSTSDKIIRKFAFSWVLLLALFVTSLLFKPELPLVVKIVMGVLTFGLAIIFGIGGYYYIELKIENNSSLLVRYYNLSPIGRQFKAFKIQLARLQRYEIKKKGPFTFICFFEQTNRGIARYPLIGFMALTKEEREMYQDFLNKLINR